MNTLFRIGFKRYFVICLALLFLLNFFNFSVVSDSENKPDLKIDYNYFLDEVNEGEEVEFVVRVKNSINDTTGEYKNISQGTKIWVALYVDGVFVSNNYSDEGLDADESVYINLSWNADLGLDTQRQILLQVDYLNNPSGVNIDEYDENNNERPGLIKVYEKETELNIEDVTLPSSFIIDNTYMISASVKNNGAATSNDIISYFNSSVDGEIEKKVYEDILYRDEETLFYFNWTPSTLGKQKISIDIIYKNKKHDEYSTSVFVGKLDWWNESWHYRYFMSLEGEGNFSKMMNFTRFLNDLGVNTGSFENNTIRVVQYSSDGDIINDTINYNFNETADYDDNSNAKGELSWKVEGSNSEKFFCIYFDVDSNPVGMRSYLAEVGSMNVSGDVEIKNSGFAEGWGFKINKPLKDSFVYVNSAANISVTTDSFAENVEVFVFLNENNSYNKTFTLDSSDNLFWSNTTVFNEIGNWTFRIKCTDSAGFITAEKETKIFVGKPDFILSDVIFETNNDAASPTIYINDTVDFKAKIYCLYATVSSVNTTMSVFNNESINVYSETKTSTFEKDKYTNISFEWKADIGGNFTVKFFVDSDNKTDESNELNNEKELDITVLYWPDLVINSISWKKTIIIEYDKIRFDVEVENIGKGDAEDYDLKLFIQPVSDKTVQYEDEVYTRKISLDSADKKEFSLFWDSAQAGSWYVAAKIFVYDEKQDVNPANNGLFITDELVVRPVEKNKPLIENVYVDPTSQEQGGVVDIFADVTDDTGLKSVFVSIYDSDENLVQMDDMIRVAGTGFKYEFSETMGVDSYTFNITAVDSSLNENQEFYESSFEIVRDSTNPYISYVGAEPWVQLNDKSLSIVCIAEDNIGIEEVKVVITTPDDDIFEESLEETSEKYVYENIYEGFGNYSYFVVVKDIAGNIKTSEEKYFYITENLDDSDNDEMPDWWEERYRFNPFDSTDSDKDYDEDGVKNYEEYLGGTHPHKNIMLQNIAYRVRSNVLYIVFSISMFALLLILYFIAKKRR